VSEHQARVLIVDDDPAIREIVAAILARERIVTDVAADDEVAIAHLNRNTYDAVLLDLLMPRVNGTEVIRHMQERGIRTPVIVITGSSEEVHDLDPSIVRVTMTKPVALQDLRDVVRAVLRATKGA
jgi:DNA-binding response OmpR family regulator